MQPWVEAALLQLESFPCTVAVSQCLEPGCESHFQRHLSSWAVRHTFIQQNYQQDYKYATKVWNKVIINYCDIIIVMSPRTLLHNFPHSPNACTNSRWAWRSCFDDKTFFCLFCFPCLLVCSSSVGQIYKETLGCEDNPQRRMRQRPHQQLNRIKKIQRGKNLVMATSTPNSSMWHQGLGSQV